MPHGDQGKAESSGLRKRFGDNVELQAENGTAETYRILAELTVGGNRYAVLQTDEMRREDEIEVFRVVEGPDGDDELESVADEDEWELAAEAYDDMQFGSDDRP